jgi:hypothetical protein
MSRVAAERAGLERFEQIPNVGRATAEDLRLLGLRVPAELAGQDPRALYDRLCDVTASRQDPCVLDVLISAVRYMEGAPARPWWTCTAERKARYPDLSAKRNGPRRHGPAKA